MMGSQETRTPRLDDRVRGSSLSWGVAVLAAMLILPPSLAAQQAPLETLILSPEPGERILQDAVLVAASFIDRDSRLDPTSIILQMDGRNVTPEAEISAEVVTWIPRQPLVPGPHRVSLTARDLNGAPISPSSWAFTVAPSAEGAPLLLSYSRVLARRSGPDSTAQSSSKELPGPCPAWAPISAETKTLFLACG